MHGPSFVIPYGLHIENKLTVASSKESTLFSVLENGTINKVGWNSKTKMFGEEENLFPDHFVTDACCSWTQLVFLTKDGDCLQWTDYTRFNEESKPVKVCSNGTKFKEVGCRESSCILVTGTVDIRQQELSEMNVLFVIRIMTDNQDYLHTIALDLTQYYFEYKG